MFSVLILSIIITTVPIGTVVMNPTNCTEDDPIQSNTSAFYSHISDEGFVWANTDHPDCENNTCVRKCCESWKEYSRTENKCVDPLFCEERLFEAIFKQKDGRSASAIKPLLLLTGWPTTLTNCTMGPLPGHRSGHLLPNGSFYTAYEDMVRDNRHYCLETYRKEGQPSKLRAFTCFTQYVETMSSKFRLFAHPISLTVSCIALLMVILCHVLIPKLRDLQGKCLLSHVCSLLVGNITLVAALLWQSFSPWQCVTLGLMMHTAYIATYMWLTVMCFDIWRYVRLSVQGISMHRLMGGEDKLFLKYCAVAWGLTGLIAAVTSIMQFLPSNALPDYIIRPHIGVNRCFIIADDANMFVYYFVILGCLCALNLALVVMTAHSLFGRGIKLCGCCRPHTKEDPLSPVFNAKHVDAFWQRFQIFITTTVLWTTEVLSFKIPPKEMWEATDFINTLQGVIIFMIFIRQKKKQDLVMGILRQISSKAWTVAQTIIRSRETSGTVVTDLPSSEKGSSKEQPVRMKTNSREDQVVTCETNFDANTVELAENIHQESNQRGENNFGLENDSN